MTLSQFKYYLLLIFLFVLPWQTRLIYQIAYLGDSYWEYGSLSLYGSEILLGLIILLEIIEKIKKIRDEGPKRIFDKIKLAKIIIGLIFVSGLYLVFSKDKQVTWQYLNWVIFGICVFFIVVENKIRFRQIVGALWAGGLVQALFAVWQFFAQYVPANKWLGLASHYSYELGTAVVENNSERYLRAYGSFGWPNSLGIYLTIVFLLGVILWMQIEKYNLLQVILLMGQIIILIGLFFTFARGAWLGLIVGFVILFYQNFKNKNIWRQAGIYILCGSVLLLIFYPLVFSRINLQNRLEKRSISERLLQWQDFKNIFGDNFLVGVGPGAYSIAVYQIDSTRAVWDYTPVHNIFLLFLAEWGIFGVCGLGCLLFFKRKFLNWSFAPLWALLVTGLFDHWIFSMFTGLVLFFIIFALDIPNIVIDRKSYQE